MTHAEYDKQGHIKHLKTALTYLQYSKTVVHKAMHDHTCTIDGCMSKDLTYAEGDIKSAILFIEGFLEEINKNG